MEMGCVWRGEAGDRMKIKVKSCAERVMGSSCFDGVKLSDKVKRRK